MSIKNRILAFSEPYLMSLAVGFTIIILLSWVFEGTQFVYAFRRSMFYVSFFCIFAGFMAIASAASYATSKLLKASKQTNEEAVKAVNKGTRIKRMGIAITAAGLTLLVIDILI